MKRKTFNLTAEHLDMLQVILEDVMDISEKEERKLRACVKELETALDVIKETNSVKTGKYEWDEREGTWMAEQPINASDWLVQERTDQYSLSVEETLVILQEWGLATTKRQLRYLLDKKEMEYMVLQVDNLVREIRIQDASLFEFLVRKRPILKEILPVYQAHVRNEKKQGT